MQKLLDDLGLQGIFRNLLPGVVLVATVIFLKHGFSEQFLLEIEKHPWSLTVLAVIGGNLVYICHRSSTNVAIDFLRHLLVHRDKDVKSLAKDFYEKGFLHIFFSKNSLHLTIERWKHEGADAYVKHLKRWADFIHNLYASALSIFVGLIVGKLGLNLMLCDPALAMIMIMAILFLSGIIGDVRRHVIEIVIYNPCQLPQSNEKTLNRRLNILRCNKFTKP